MSTPNRRAAAIAFAAVLLVPALARAQDAGPDPEEMKQKILEIERLMKGAEESLARSVDTRSAAEKAAEASRKMLDKKAREETGKSSEELRKLAEGGSKEAAETLERLTKAANEEAAKAAKKISEVLDGNTGGGGGGSGGGGASGAGQGIREVIKRVKGEGKGASDGIRWILSKTKVSSGGGSGSPDKEKKPDSPDPNKPDPKKPDEKPKPDDRKPESKTEPPRTPEFEQWYAELPPQVRKAYDSQDWDSIPPKWREMLKDWTKKMAEDLEKERR